jgi:putative membrane protein
MDGPAQSGQTADLRDSLAAERTLLAWIRTGLALMGFGFVVARFALFLEQVEVVQHVPAVETSGLSMWFGTALMGAGVAALLLAAWHHSRLIKELNRGQAVTSHSQALAIATCLFLALVGIGMAIYLISVRGSAHPLSENSKEMSMAPNVTNGILSKASNHSVDETLEKFKRILQAKGVHIFAIVDHSGEVQKVGLEMRPTKLAIFGNPKAGTPLILSAPSTALDLPL